MIGENLRSPAAQPTDDDDLSIYLFIYLCIYLFIYFFFNLGDPLNALALFFLGAQVAQGHT